MATLARSVHMKLLSSWRSPVLIAAVAALVAALLQSLLVPLDCDVSWLITANEKLLSGLRLYIDVLEPNPPASIWLYTPAVWAAQQLHLRAEAVVVTAFIAGALVSCAAVYRLSGQLRSPPDKRWLIAALSFVTLILPLGTFAQREHAALLLALPALAGLAVLAEERTLSLAASIALGIAAGLVIAIKPHFTLAIALAATFAWTRSRALRPMIAPAGAAAATVALYGIAVALFTPQYLKLIPMLAETYLPLREQWPTLVRGPVIIVPVAICALVFGLRSGRLATLPAMFLVGSVGFTLAALIQMKGYINHALPAMALGFVGLALALRTPQIDRARGRLIGAAGALLAALQLYAMGSIQPPIGLAQSVERVAPPHPGIITLGPDLLTGHPVVRNVDGSWVGSRPALFVAAGARRALATTEGASRARLEGWYRADLQTFAADVRRMNPDVVLVDARPDTAWLRSEPLIVAAMRPYKPATRAGDVEVWIRR